MSIVKVDSIQSTNGVEKYLIHAYTQFAMNTNTLSNTKGISSLTDLGVGSPQFNLSNALSVAGGWADVTPVVYAGGQEYPLQSGARVSATTTVKGFCGSDNTSRADWQIGYFAVASI